MEEIINNIYEARPDAGLPRLHHIASDRRLEPSGDEQSAFGVRKQAGDMK